MPLCENNKMRSKRDLASNELELGVRGSINFLLTSTLNSPCDFRRNGLFSLIHSSLAIKTSAQFV